MLETLFPRNKTPNLNFFIDSLLIRRIRNFCESFHFLAQLQKTPHGSSGHPRAAAVSLHDDAGLNLAGSDSVKLPVLRVFFSNMKVAFTFLEYASSPFAKITVYEANIEWYSVCHCVRNLMVIFSKLI